MGHEVRLMSPQFVKHYVKTNKNYTADAEAICEAASRPTMRSVSLKSIEQQDIQALHEAERTKRWRCDSAFRHFFSNLLSLKNKYGGLLPYKVKRLKMPEEENRKLKQLVGDLSLDEC